MSRESYAANMIELAVWCTTFSGGAAARLTSVILCPRTVPKKQNFCSSKTFSCKRLNAKESFENDRYVIKLSHFL